MFRLVIASSVDIQLLVDDVRDTEVLCCCLAKIGGSVSRRARKGGLGGAWFSILGGTVKMVVS